MTPDTRAALRTRARAEVRCEVALMQYRRARSYWVGGPPDFMGRRYARDTERTLVARARWSTLHDLLAADAVETTVAA